MATVLITGSTGMVGKGVLKECLEDQSIEKIVLINRSSVDINDPKIKEILLKDFQQLKKIKEEIGHIDACFHCMGVSAIGLSESTYHELTYGVSKLLADICYEINPKMTFIYVSGTGTDSSEKGNVMWARVKGKTENYLLRKKFVKALMFRPGVIIPEKGTRSKVTAYRIIYFFLRPFFPWLKKSNKITTTTRIGRAMIKGMNLPNDKTHFENIDINQLAKK